MTFKLVKSKFSSDFESLLVDVPECKNLGAKQTQNLKQHHACGFGYLIVSPYKQFNTNVKIYRGENAAEKFIESLDYEYKAFYKHLNPNKPLIMTAEDEISHKEANICYICTKEIFDNDKAKDHDHITGEYRGAAHINCNLQMSQPIKMVVFMHNSRG